MKSKEQLLTKIQEAWNKPDSLQQCVNVADKYALQCQIDLLDKLQHPYAWQITQLRNELQTKLKSL